MTRSFILLLDKYHEGSLTKVKFPEKPGVAPDVSYTKNIFLEEEVINVCPVSRFVPQKLRVIKMQIINYKYTIQGVENILVHTPHINRTYYITFIFINKKVCKCVGCEILCFKSSYKIE